METPKSLRQRPTRNPTPRLSERKKSLFAAARNDPKESKSDSEQENNVLDGVKILSEGKDNKKSAKHSVEGLLKKKTPKKAISFLRNNNNSSPERMYDELFEKLPDSPPAARRPLSKEKSITPTRRSGRLSLKPKNGSPPANSIIHTTPGKENNPRTPSPRQVSKTFTDELQDMFSNSMNLNKNKKSSSEEEEIEIIEESSSDEDDGVNDRFKAKKRPSSPPKSEAKVPRLNNNNSKRLSISTKCFYSNSKTSPTSSAGVVKSPPKKFSPTLKPFSKGRTFYVAPKPNYTINKGVHHGIKKKPKPKPKPSVPKKDILNIIRNEKLRNLLTTKRQEKDQIESVHRILQSAKNPIAMAKPLSIIARPSNDSDGNNNAHTEPSKRCYMNGYGEISMGFSDIECSSDSEDEEEPAPTEQSIEEALQEEVNELLAEPEEPTPLPGRKFFKSGHSGTKKEVKITDKITASVCNGKLSIMTDTKQHRKKKLKLRETRVNEFSSEQAKVDEIIKNFDISIIAPVEEVIVEEPIPSPADFVQIESNPQLPPPSPTVTCSENGFDDDFEDLRMTETEAEDDDEYREFRRRIPYNTNNPELIEQQHILLDFLVQNKICTEENFTIFIADPDNHKAEAQRIVDQLVVVVNDPESFRQRLPYNTTDPAEIEQQKSFLDFLIENNMCNEENFEIFIADYANRQDEADRIITQVVASTHNISAEELERELSRFNTQQTTTTTTPESMDIEIPDQNREIQRVLEASPDKLFPIFYPGRCQPILKQTSTRRLARDWKGGYGSNQYQIDAGQRQYGARFCKQCGLLYTVNEPEEEKLHKEYHASLHVLKFKSWIDEDIVQIYTEWGADGRILRLNENSHLKRLERLRDVLKLVDKELGFYSYIMPSVFVAYLAIRQNQIAGVCLVEPLDKAHRYVKENGVDCCTVEPYEAKCGISRIWVSPLHRRFHIATKLIRAVQLHTIFGEEIPLDKIAFSAPTEDGKNFAMKVTNMNNFLVYQ